MINALQSAERHFLGEVITTDVVMFYEYPLNIYSRVSHSTDAFKLSLYYLLARLSSKGIRVQQTEGPLNKWSPDNYDDCMRYGTVIDPIPSVAFSAESALSNIPGSYNFPVLVASHNERSGESHVWFAADDIEFNQNKVEHLARLNGKADNYYACELRAVR